MARFNRVKPTMNSRANLAVFLYELRDIKRMFELLPKKHLLDKRGKRFKDWRSALKYANGQHLNYAFGWRPFLNDVKNTFRGLSTFEERLSKFVNQANTDLRRHASDQSESSGSYVWNGGAWEATLSWSFTAKHTSTFWMNYSVPNYSERELRVRAYLDTLGLQINLANIWAVIPWSFVVDWFVGVGKYLDAYSVDWLEPWINLLQASSSVKCEGTANVTLRYTGYSNPPLKVGDFQFKAYHRRLGTPGNEVLFGDLNPDKIRLLASLVVQQVV